MNIAIFGSDGQLGTDVVSVVKRHDNQCSALCLNDADITDTGKTEALLTRICPDVVINCSAFHDVAKCEENSALAEAVNRDAVGAVSRICRHLRAKFVTVSTDYVFDGTRMGGYTEEDTPNPINVYGRTKLEGEILALSNNPRALVVRTQSLYGAAKLVGKKLNFVDFILKLSKERSELQVDQCTMAPTGTWCLAENMYRLICSEHYGLFHMSCHGATTWYEFAKKILELIGANVRVTPVPNDFFPRNFRRPENTYLINKRLSEVGLDCMPSWQESLIWYLRSKGCLC